MTNSKIKSYTERTRKTWTVRHDVIKQWHMKQAIVLNVFLLGFLLNKIVFEQLTNDGSPSQY